MKNTFKKVLFSLWAIGLVWAGSLGMVNAALPEQECIDFAEDGTCITSQWSQDLIEVIRKFINRILTLLATIALVICLWWGFQMLTAAWDENKYKKWFTILKQAWIWLIIIGLSRIIVRLIFWLITMVSSGS